MRLRVKFSESKQTFRVAFSETIQASDGGYDRGYAQGYDAGQTQAVDYILGGAW